MYHCLLFIYYYCKIKDSLRITVAEKGIDLSKSFREQKDEILPSIIKNVCIQVLLCLIMIIK